MLLQADTIDETVQWLKGYLEALAARNAEATEATLAEPVLKAAEPLSPPPQQKLAPSANSEIESEALAEAPSMAKV